MSKKITKRTKCRVFLIMLITALILAVFSLNIWKMFSQVMDTNKEAIFLKEEMKHLKDEESYLKVEVEKLNDPDYVARYAREKYLYSKDGEFTIKLP